MNAVQNRVSENRKSWSERIKSWLSSSNRRIETKHTIKPRLESLEERDVPSTMGIEGLPQIQADMAYLNSVYQQQIATIQKDVNVLFQDVQHGQTGRLGGDVHQLLNDYSKAGQAVIGAIDAIMSGHVPSPATSNTGQTPAPTTSNAGQTPAPTTSNAGQTPATTTLNIRQTPPTTTPNNTDSGTSSSPSNTGTLPSVYYPPTNNQPYYNTLEGENSAYSESSNLGNDNSYNPFSYG